MHATLAPWRLGVLARDWPNAEENPLPARCGRGKFAAVLGFRVGRSLQGESKAMGSGPRARRSWRGNVAIRLTVSLREEYERLFNTCEIRPEWMARVNRAVRKIETNRKRYERVSAPLGIPWAVIGAIHQLESSLSFSAHLHNGDPLTARTVHEPSGRPAEGEPPFTWEESASDAVRSQGLNRWDDWSIAGTLYQFERYNGWGYRLFHPEALSPYLWGGSRHYTRGKYIGDHQWAASAISEQVGAAVVLRRMTEITAPSGSSSAKDSETIPIPGMARDTTKKRTKRKETTLCHPIMYPPH